MPVLERLPRAVLFDWDNTLVDTWPVIHDAMNATLAAMGHALWTIEETQVYVRRSMREAFPEMFGDCWEEAKQVFYDRFDEIHLKRLVACPDAGRIVGRRYRPENGRFCLLHERFCDARRLLVVTGRRTRR